MALKIEDTFGERIGLSRRDIWQILHGGNVREKLAELSGKDRELFVSMATRDALWPRPDFASLLEEDGDDDAGFGLAYRMNLDRMLSANTVRLALPPSGESAEYVEKVLSTREMTSEMLATGKIEEFIEKIRDMWDWDVLKRMKAGFKNHGRNLQNALVVRFPEWTHPSLFSAKTRLSFMEGERGVRGFFGGEHVSFDSLEEFRRHADSLKKERTRNVQPVRPMLKAVTRKGCGENSVSVSPEMFQERFAFRGGEFGNWLSQEDRRQSLCWAMDSFSDLARILNIDDSAIGGNSLAFAFGARGNGGMAAAHYEPILNVINLTKMGGAGACAHEWGHYLDFHILKPQGKGSSRMDWLWRRPIQDEDELLLIQRERELMDGERKLATWIPKEERASVMDAIRKAGPDEYRRLFSGAINKYIYTQSQAKAKHWHRYLDHCLNVRYSHTDNAFMKNARKLDEGKSKKYWSSPEEMWARAFEKFVDMKLREKGYHNDYLVGLYQCGIDPYPSETEMEMLRPEIERIISGVFSPRKEMKEKPAADTGWDMEFDECPPRHAEQLSLF